MRENRAAVGRLLSFIKRYTPTENALPLVHTTPAYRFADFIDESHLEPNPCEHFKENLIYFFYGRPSYRAADGASAYLEFEWPIIFIFDPHKITQIRRVYPFDTGAFFRGLYESFFHRNSEISDFELPASIDSAKMTVSAFYENNNNYYRGVSTKNLDIEPMQFEVQGLQELSRLPGVQDPLSGRTRDERSSSIEIQVDHAIKFEDSALAIILPEPYLEVEGVIQAISRWKIDHFRTYTCVHNQSSETWVGEVYGIVRTLYQELGYLQTNAKLL